MGGIILLFPSAGGGGGRGGEAIGEGIKSKKQNMEINKGAGLQ